MANYNLETETTTHIKGMSFGESSDTGGGEITVYTWTQDDGLPVACAAIMFDSYDISLFYEKPSASDYFIIRTDGLYLASARKLYINTSNGFTIPDSAKKFTLDNVSVSMMRILE